MNVIALLFLVVGASYANAQTMPVYRPAVPVPQPFEALPVQRIGPNDLISIQVSDCPELSRSFRVSSDGTLALPLLEHRVTAAGLMPVELEGQLAKELKAAGILVAPVVSASVSEYRSRPVSVVGAVHHPLTFQAMSDSTLIDAIAKAEGVNADAGTFILVTRRRTDGKGSDGKTAEAEVQRIPLKRLMDASDPSLNLKLVGGEEIRVQEAGKVFVTGNVIKPGVYAMQDNADTTVLKALALSEGLKSYSSKLAYIYRRDPETNTRTEMSVELEQIMARKSPDVDIAPDDILYIPENKGRKMTMGALERLAGFGTSTASGLLIWK
jgi:polysaccharide export outer membrane protein